MMKGELGNQFNLFQFLNYRTNIDVKKSRIYSYKKYTEQFYFYIVVLNNQ